MPTHSASLKDALSPAAAIGLPVAWGAVAGGAGAIVAGSLAWHNGDGQPLAIAALAGGATFGLAWLRAMSWWGGLVGDLVGRQAPAVDPAAYAMQTTRIALTLQEGESPYLHGQWFDLPLPKDRVKAACAHVVKRNYDFSMGANSGKGKPLSRSEYESFRDVLIEQSLAEWNNPHAKAQGVRLNGAGRSFVRKWADLSNPNRPTLPTPQDLQNWLTSLEHASARVRA